MVLKLTKRKICLIDSIDTIWIGKHKWSVTKNGSKFYAVRNEKGRRIYLHREVFGAKKGEFVDHINNDSLDNRRKNLSLSDKSKNSSNSFKYKNKKSSKFKGVHWHSQIGRWRAVIHFKNKKISLGCYSTEKLAAKAYINAARRYFGEFARLSVRSDFKNQRKF